MKRDRSRTISNLMSWGSPFCTSASRALTASTTATVLVPDCLRMRRETALSPFSRESVRGSSSPSRTTATSRTRTGLPFESATMRSSKASTDSMRPSVRRPSSERPAVRRPPGISTFWRWSASFSVWMERLNETSLSGSASDLDLALPVADEGDRADVLDRLERALDALVGDLGDLARRALAGDDQGQDRRGVRIDLLDDGRLRPGGEAGQHRPDLFPDVVGRLLHVALEHEGREDLRLPLDGGRAQLVEAADGVDDLLDLLGDLALDLLGRGAGQAAS